MILKVFSVRDDKAKSYLQPFFMINEEVAIRAIQNTLTDESHQFAQHPHDFSLYDLGAYDDQTGMFEVNKAPEYVAHIVDLYPEKKGDNVAKLAKVEAV